MSKDAMEQEFLESFRVYGDAIFRFCMVKVSNRELAEDFTQEVFMRYWQSLREGKEMTNTRSFLYTVAHNMAKDWYKRKKADSLDSHMERGYEPASERENSETGAMYQEVLSNISGMDSGDAEVLLLKYVEGLEPRDIAVILGETPNVVSVRLNRAMKRLQSKLHI
jgi:RNA polymerase sigma-70 factor (ECF subfamily)